MSRSYHKNTTVTPPLNHWLFHKPCRAFLYLLCLTGLFTTSPPGLAATTSWSPILKLDLSYQPSSLARYAMQYEVSDLPTIVNASNLRSVIQSYESLRSQSKNDVQVAYDRLHAAVAIKYYLERSEAIGKGVSSMAVGLPAGRVRTLIARIIQDVRRDSAFLFKKTKDDRALFQFFRYTIGDVSPTALKELSKILKDPKAPPALRYRVYFVQLYYGLNTENAVLNLKSARTLEGRYYSRAKGVSVAASVASALALARAYAGIFRGQKIRRSTHPNYMRYLKDVTARLPRMDAILKEKVIAQVLNIWSLAEKTDFSSLPFSVAAAAGTPYYLPLLEREALAKRMRDIKTSKRIYGHTSWQTTYRKLASQESLTPHHHLFLKRLLDDRQAQYRATKNYTQLEKEIHWQLRKIGTEPKSQALKEYYITLTQNYRSLIDLETQIALKPNTPAEKKRAYLALVERYLKVLPHSKVDRAELYERQGRVFILVKQYPQAVRKFTLAYSLTNLPQRKIYYLDLAISAQRFLARWPQRPPFGLKLPPAPLPSLKSLADLYSKKIQEQQPTSSAETAEEGSAATTLNWNDVAHLGLLQIALRQEIQAADLFFKTLRSLPQHALVSPAAFTALEIYERKKLWQKLEDLALLLTKNKIIPTLKGRKIDPQTKLALALLEGGKALLRQKQYTGSISKLKAFVQLFPRSGEIPTARFYLARSYWGSQDHLAAMNELQTITRHHKKYRDYKQVVLLGLQWGQALAIEEAVIFFSEAYIGNYKDRKAYDLRLQIRGLYEGTERYKESVRNLMALKESSFSSQKQKDTFDMELLWNIKEYGSTAEALKISDDLIKSSKDPSVLAEAFKVRTALFAESRDAKRLQDLNQQLSSLSFQTAEIREARADVLLALLKITDTSRLDEEVQSIALKSPEGYIKSSLEEFKKFRGFYQNICSFASPSACLEAAHLLNVIGEKIKENIREVEINASLAEEVKDKFAAVKASILRDIDGILESSKKRSSSMMAHSGGTPQTVLNMLWIQNKDWNFDPLTWGQSSGYIFWQMKGEREP